MLAIPDEDVIAAHVRAIVRTGDREGRQPVGRNWLLLLLGEWVVRAREEELDEPGTLRLTFEEHVPGECVLHRNLRSHFSDALRSQLMNDHVHVMRGRCSGV